MEQPIIVSIKLTTKIITLRQNHSTNRRSPRKTTNPLNPPRKKCEFHLYLSASVLFALDRLLLTVGCSQDQAKLDKLHVDLLICLFIVIYYIR
jgi:hypothetical protein